MKNNNNAWSHYWSANNQGCIANEDDQLFVNRLWQQWLKRIAPSGKVLDLATGNGAVIKAFLAANTSHQFEAVDYAQILPFSQNTCPSNVNFLANTNIEQLPYADNTFDGVVSQFGFEYADIDNAAKELVRVCKVGAKVMLIIHYQNSEIMKANGARLTEISHLLSESGVVSSAKAYSEGALSQLALEEVGQHYLKQYHGKLTKPISGQVFESINQVVIDYYGGRKAQAKTLMSQLETRLIAEQTRLKALTHAARSKQDIDDLCATFREIGLYANAEILNTADGLDLAWIVTGERT